MINRHPRSPGRAGEAATAMATDSHPACCGMTTVAPLLRALERRDDLSADERALVERLPARRRKFARGQEMVPQGSRPRESCLLVSGLAGRVQHVGEEGKRQITALHIAGDFVDLHSMLLKVMDHDVVALADCEAVFIPHERLIDVTIRSPHLGRLLWLSTLIDAAIQRTWMSSIGRRSSAAQLAHLVCETYLRMEAVGLVRDLGFDLPITQQELGDALGISTVHANRTLQELRATGLLKWRGSRVTIVDFDRLAAFADFDATYLNLVKEPR
jgi:CRP-like cAMP-binding protein